MKIDEQFYASMLNSLKNPIVFVDTTHVVRYVNRAAISHYKEGESLLGTSIYDCHNDDSNKVIDEVFAALQNGEEERLITDSEKHRVYMRAVRDDRGTLIGYYERYEPPKTEHEKP